MAGARDRQRVDVAIFPLLVIEIVDGQRDGSAGGVSAHDAARNSRVIVLNLHARAGTVTRLALRQIAIDING